MEGGKVGIRRSTLERLLEIYEVDDREQIETLIVLAKEGKTRGWFARYGDLPASYSRYIGLESSAAEIRNYEALVVPGMLQTEEYTRALLAASPGETDESIDAHVKARRDRQGLITRTDSPPLNLIVVLDESVVRRLIGGPDVMRSQLKRLADAARSRNVTIQILPFSGGAYAGM